MFIFAWKTKKVSLQIYSSGWNLASFKTMPTIMPVDESSRRPYMGRCCACMPASKVANKILSYPILMSECLRFNIKFLNGLKFSSDFFICNVIMMSSIITSGGCFLLMVCIWFSFDVMEMVIISITCMRSNMRIMSYINMPYDEDTIYATCDCR